VAWLIAATLVAISVTHRYDVFERFARWGSAHETWQVDELAVISMVLVVALGLFAWRRWHEAAREAAIHRSTAERLLASEERFRRAFEVAATGVALVGVPDGRFLRVNPAGCEMLGYTADELAAMTIVDVTHPDDRAACSDRFRRVVTGELASSRARLRHLRRDGSTAHVLVSTAVVRDAAGNPIHMIAHVIDVTEQESARQRLIELLASKDELIASVSHELRTPLAAMIGFADLLRDDSLLSPGERDEITHAIVEQGNDLANIVEDLLVAARIDTDSLVVARVSVDLRAQVAQVLESLQHSGELPRITLGGRIGEAIADPARVRQIVRNLVGNALRYGGPDVEIRIAADDSTIRLEVSDDGPGVPPGEAARIFEPYHRAHTREGLTASVGLGLTISLRLARAMDGDLGYRRQHGRSVFELTLPAAIPAPSGDSDTTAAIRRPDPAPAPALGPAVETPVR
jgi:PAS domain S-box-containing protein